MEPSIPTVRPRLSVIVPMYQSGTTVAETLRSIVQDSIEGGVEVVVVDDGSTDDGPEIVARLAATDSRVRVLHQSNQGLAAARNAGIAHARGQWLRFLDADDLAVAGSSRRLIKHAERMDLPAACGSHELVGESGERLDRVCPARCGPDGTIGLNELLTGNCLGVGTLVIRADALGGDRFDTSLRVCEDWDLWVRLAERAMLIGVCRGEPVKLYRVRRASLSKDFAGMLRIGSGIMQAAFGRARASRADGVDASEGREAAALHRLALEWATMRALGDQPDRVSQAEEMYASVSGLRMDADDIAGAAFWGALLGLGIRPERLDAAGRAWVQRTASWWERCVDRGWLEKAERDAAWQRVAEMLPTAAEIARECVAQAGQAPGVVIVGAGQNGRAVAAAADERGVRWEYRDDDIRGGAMSGMQPIAAAPPKGWQIIVSPLRDGPILPRLCPPANVRWSVVRNELARNGRERIHAVLQGPKSPNVSPESPPRGHVLAVVIPMFNSAATVEETIRSAQAQNVDGLRIIVVNDGSTDDGPLIVQRMARDDPRIAMISQANRGLAGARNTGIEAAIREGARFLHFLDADDRMCPGAYTALLRAAGATGASYGGYALVNEAGKPLGRESPISAPIVGLDEELEWNRAATHARLLSVEALGDQRFDERLPVCEDYDLWLRLEMRGVRFVAVERIVCDYRLRAASLSKKFDQMGRVYQDVVRRAFHAARPGWEDRVDLSDRRFRRVVGHSALMYATMEAIRQEDDDRGRAADLLRASARPDRFSPADLAQAACTAVLFGSCSAPVLDGVSEQAWLVPLVRWWSRCEQDGWCEAKAGDSAIVELSRKIIHPDVIALSMLDAAACATPMPLGLVVVGMDRNGRRLARLAASRGTRTLVLDDATPEAEAGLLEPLAGVRVVRHPAEFGEVVAKFFPRAAWVTGRPSDDATGMVERVARVAAFDPRAVDRWNTHRDRLGEANLAKMRESLRPLPASHAMSPAWPA